MKCQCPEPGMCPVFNRLMVNRKYAICSGTSGLPKRVRRRYLALWAKQRPTGLGDYVHQFASALRIPHLLKLTGVDCGCNKRRTWLNNLFRRKH